VGDFLYKADGMPALQVCVCVLWRTAVLGTKDSGLSRVGNECASSWIQHPTLFSTACPGGSYMWLFHPSLCMQTGVGSSNDAVVCACIRVSGALLQAMLAASQQQLSTWCGASNNSSIPRQHRQQGQQQWLSEDGALLLKSSLRLGRHESYAAAAAAHAQAREKQNATRGAALPGSHNNSTAAGAAPPSVSMLVPLSSTGANSSCWAVADDTSSSFGDLVAAAGSVLTHVAAAAASLQHTADARVAAFQELQQLMLLLADANVQAANTLTAQPLPPPTHQQPWVGSISGLPIQQQNGMCGGASSSIAAPDSASAGGCRSFSSGQSSNSWSGNSNSRAVLVAALTGPAQLQQVLQAAMHALTDPQASLRR
jgi:hypothetical protein